MPEFAKLVNKVPSNTIGERVLNILKIKQDRHSNKNKDTHNSVKTLEFAYVEEIFAHRAKSTQ